MSSGSALPTGGTGSSTQRSGNLLVLLHAFEKDTGSIADADIELAKKRMSDFKRRMDAKPRRRPRAAGKDAPPKNR